MTPRVALCGAGMISHVHALAARHLGLDLIAISSRSTTRARQRAETLKVDAIDYSDLPGGADIVIVASPPSSHCDHALHSLERGAAVVVEKPLTSTLRDADRLVLASERHGSRVLYAENLAYAPSFQRWVAQIAHMVRSESLTHLSATMVQPAPSWGDFLEPHWGGGVLFELGVHPIALIVLTARAAGAGEVVAVSATLLGETTDDHADVDLVFSSGLHARIVVSWRGGDVPHWTVQAASPSAALTLELLPAVSLQANGNDVDLARAATDPEMIDDLGYVGQLRAFVHDLESRSTPWMTTSFGRWILEIVCAAYVSARAAGDTVPVPSGCDRDATPWELWRDSSNGDPMGH